MESVEMDKRNKLSIVLISFILIGGSIAIPILVRDYETIINDFINSPIFPPPISELGTLNLYYTSDFSEENLTLIEPLGIILNADNDTETILRIWISITEITLLGKKAGNSLFFTSDDVFDVLDALNDTQLLKTGNITAAEYAGIQLHFNTTILIQTDVDFYTFEIQGNNIIALPFNMFNQVNSTTDLNIVNETINDVLLDFNIEVLWQNSTARIITKAYVLE